MESMNMKYLIYYFHKDSYSIYSICFIYHIFRFIRILPSGF